MVCGETLENGRDRATESINRLIGIANAEDRCIRSGQETQHRVLIVRNVLEFVDKNVIPAAKDRSVRRQCRNKCRDQHVKGDGAGELSRRSCGVINDDRRLRPPGNRGRGQLAKGQRVEG